MTKRVALAEQTLRLQRQPNTLIFPRTHSLTHRVKAIGLVGLTDKAAGTSAGTQLPTLGTAQPRCRNFTTAILVNPVLRCDCRHGTNHICSERNRIITDVTTNQHTYLARRQRLVRHCQQVIMTVRLAAVQPWYRFLAVVLPYWAMRWKFERSIKSELS